MKIKRFVAKDIRQAMRMVKDELGADAVIMSNRSVGDGVEIVAARDFDEQVFHDGIESLSSESDKISKARARKDLLDFETEKNKLHVISSPRKKNVDGSIPPRRSAKRGIDQYEGYAEKKSLSGKRNDLYGKDPTTRAGSKPITKLAVNNLAMENSQLKSTGGLKKMQADGSIPKHSGQKNIDQYVGYAEKVDLLGDHQQTLSNKKTVASKNVMPIAEGRPARVEKKQSFEGSPDQFIQEMRNEINVLKAAMDSKLSEISRGQNVHNNPVRIDLLTRLTEMGFSRKLSIKIANRLDSHKDSEAAFTKAKEMLAKVLPITEDELLEYGGIYALVGPTGVGKTTTIAKLAAQFILKHGARQVALITTDNYRIGAHEQLITYGRLLDVPVRSAANAEELKMHINSFNDKSLILIDTAGMSQRDMRLAEQIQTLQQENIPIKSYLVMSAATQYKSINEIIDAFKIFEPSSSILTKLDETVDQGAILSAVIEHQLAISFITNGQQVPEDIYIPDAVGMIESCANGLEKENDYNNALRYDDWMAESYA